MLTQRKTLLGIAEESKLIHFFDDGSYYTVNNSYEFYLRTLLKYNYEHSDYDLSADSERYKNKQDTFKPFTDIAVTEDTITDDFFGDFYTKFIIGKCDLDNNLIVDFKGQNPKEYFYYEVLDIDGVGATFFEATTGAFPYFKKEVRQALYSYNFLKTIGDKEYQIDKQFFQYFVQIYNISGELLTKYGNYKELLTSHDLIYSKLINYDILGISVSFAAAYLLLIVILPLFTKYKQNLGEFMLHRTYLVDTGESEKFTAKSYLIRIAYGLIKYLPAGFLTCAILNPSLAFTTMFYLGTFPVSLFLIALVALIVNTVSICISIIKSKEKNLETMLSGTRVYSVIKDHLKEK